MQALGTVIKQATWKLQILSPSLQIYLGDTTDLTLTCLTTDLQSLLS